MGTLGSAFDAAKDTMSPGIDYLGMVQQIGKGITQATQPTQPTQQPNYQSMVPPQSMTISPPPQQPGQPRTMPSPQATAMQQAAQRRLATPQKEEDSGLGSALGTIVGGIAGAFAGNPAAGAGIGSAVGGGIESLF